MNAFSTRVIDAASTKHKAQMAATLLKRKASTMAQDATLGPRPCPSVHSSNGKEYTTPAPAPVPAPTPTPASALAGSAALCVHEQEAGGLAGYSEPWSVKYAPDSLEAAVLQPKTSRDAVFSWLRTRVVDSDQRGPKVLILRGPSGCGKSSFIRAAAASLGAAVQQPEGVDTFDKLLTIVREGVRAKPLALGVPEAEKKRVWLFAGIDGFAESSDEAGVTPAAGPGGRRSTTAVVAALVELIKKTYLPRTGTQHKASMSPIVFTLHDFSTHAVRQLQHMDAVRVVTVSAVDGNGCRFAINRVLSLGGHAASALLTPSNVADVVATTGGDLRQCVNEAQTRYCVARCSRGGQLSALRTWRCFTHYKVAASAVPCRRDTALDVFETTRVLLDVQTKVSDSPGCIPGIVDVHANALAFLASNWLFDMDVTARRVASVRDADAMACIASACDAWCVIYDSMAWRGGRAPSAVQLDVGIITGVMQLREARKHAAARAPTGKLDYKPPLAARKRPSALTSVKVASVTTYTCGNLELNERLWCACELVKAVGRTVTLAPPPMYADVFGGGAESTWVQTARRLTDVPLLFADPFYATYGIPRNVVSQCLPDLTSRRHTSGPAVAGGDWKILDVEGWRQPLCTARKN